jgi:nicotinate phosphoribosyltransferase
LLAARASYLAGFDGTSTALAGARFGIPVFGTMAHSFVQAHDSEADAFAHFAAAFPEKAVLLIDTYDTVEGARIAVRATPELKGVRLDSGDLDDLSRKVRQILDANGAKSAIIFASGNLDEDAVGRLVAAGAPIDSFGVGTAMTTSADQPYLDAVYKLQEYAGRPRRKRSTGKATWPGRKQVYRRYTVEGSFLGDTVTLETDALPADPLIVPVMRGGRRLPQPSLEESRKHCLRQLARLPKAFPYPVEISPALRAAADAVDRSLLTTRTIVGS